MAEGEGANWEIIPHDELPQDGATQDGAVNFEVKVSSSVPGTGVVQIQIVKGDTAAKIAKKLAVEWNDREPIKDVVAVQADHLTAFFLTGPLADGEHSITEMAVTFPGQDRRVMLPPDKTNPYGPPVSWEAGEVRVSRGPVTIT